MMARKILLVALTSVVVAIVVAAPSNGPRIEQLHPEEESARSTVSDSALACLLENEAADVVDCALGKVNARLDEIQRKGRKDDSQERVSEIFKDTRAIVARGVDEVFSGSANDATGSTSAIGARFLNVLEEINEEAEDEENKDAEDDSVGEARKKKFGKKKKKALQKILMLAMVLKAKLSLLLQIFSTHLQVKFFGIALLSLLLNLARFWIDLKRGGSPSKVIYYEHAQHQHHYDHEDEHSGYWGRSSDDAQGLAYSGYHHAEEEPVDRSISS